jgi:hypothetical protein
MITEKFNVSQKFEIIAPQTGKAYPIGLKEWNFLKKKIKEIKVEINNFHAIGYLLLGASASCLITILATTFQDDKSKYICWSIFFVTLIGGFLSIYFATDKHKQESAKPQEILNQMELIESRFEEQEDEVK